MIDFKRCNLESLLSHKTMYYDKIDFTIIKRSWEIIEQKIKTPFVIHIVGTNGKGSTGRFLSHYLNKIGKNVLHYSSPHIKRFNERIWINGEDISDLKLEESHKILQNILDLDLLEKLTYFEYTTLLALFNSSDKDYLVLEAGLGGEFDGTNVIFNDLTLITTIDLDHMNFLGNTIKDISYTKMRACDSNMILGHQVHKEVLIHAQTLANERNYNLFEIKDFEFLKNYKDLNFVAYLLKNLDLCLASLVYLKIDIDLSIFKSIKLHGRFERIEPNIIIDVGHNPLAAKEIKNNFNHKKIILVYNSYADKDYTEVLKILKPIIKEVQILEINDSRMADINDLIKVCNNYNIIVSKFKKNSKNENYLVFGSFLVVERFLEIYER
ncbi:MAG: bifunctional folylpolyglutamate synthase/dihydrofolate synthase [Campylobacteraceae bacterium]|nr:bifunctional folylpolyglutamate synthase/dihydrofolate synthase [Campylobacteraceae bacterium]